MADYLHGAYGQINAVGARVSQESQGVIVYVGTAPVHTIDGGSTNVNVPKLVKNIDEARKIFGYSDDWTDYTLCEAMHVHFEQKAVGPIVLINVLDPATHKAGSKTSTNKTPANGMITIADEDCILDTVVIKTTASTPVTKVKGTDYTIGYDFSRKTVVIREIGTGLGTSELSVEYYKVDATAVTSTDVIGSTDGLGENTGLYAVKDVYQLTGRIPAYLLCPGFCGIPAVHNVMATVSKKINGHWDAYMFVDLPLIDNSTALTLDTVVTWKATNNYNRENETVYFPMALGTDGNKYHISVLAAANFQELLLDQDGIPYRSASNTECAIIENLYMGESNRGKVYDDSIINEKLNKNGICSAAYVGGRWAIWGAHSADYSYTSLSTAPSFISVFETNRLMLYYISNDFQARRMIDVDKPMSPNDLKTIVSEEQTRLDALINIGALTFGEVSENAEMITGSDIVNGDFSFTFNVTTTPLAKSLTAIVNWTDEGFVTYFATEEE